MRIKSTLGWFVLGSALIFAVVACKPNDFSSRADRSAQPEPVPAPSEDQVPRQPETTNTTETTETVIVTPLALDGLSICRKLLGIPEGEECRLPGNSIFGGSYQSGAITMVNPRTAAESCPNGFDPDLSMTIAVAGGAVGSADAYVDSRLYLCLVSEDTEYPETQDPACPVGQAKVTATNGEEVCSDLPVKACAVLGGTFDGVTGRCGIKPQESVFGGMFVSGDDDSGLGMVTVLDADAAGDPIEEFCENGNKFANAADCACPAAFTAYTSSSMIEFEAGVDRPSYCVGQEAEDVDVVSDDQPLDSCQNPWERRYIVADQSLCSPIVYEICQSLGGVLDSEGDRCIYSRDSFFGGSFQIGFSNHQMTDGVPWNALPATLRDNTIANANQFCEAPNPESGQVNELQCSCPNGFVRHPLIYHPETQDAAGDYDKEFICVRQ